MVPSVFKVSGAVSLINGAAGLTNGASSLIKRCCQFNQLCRQFNQWSRLFGNLSLFASYAMLMSPLKGRNSFPWLLAFRLTVSYGSLKV